MLDLRACRIQDPIELHPYILYQRRSNFDIANIRRVVLRSIVIVLQQARGVEIMYEWLRGGVLVVGRVRGMGVENRVCKVSGCVEVGIDGVDFGDEAFGRLLVGVAEVVPAFPERL